MYLYIWSDYMTDYKPGLAVAVARDEKEAIEKLSELGANLGCLDAEEPRRVEIHSDKAAAFVSGGG